MRQQWEDILKERLSTILDGLLGMALGLRTLGLSHQSFCSLKS